MQALSDDNNFARSRKYFWAIGCLTEFIASISGNIKQWDLYYEGRILLILEWQDLEAQLHAASITEPPPLGGRTKTQSTLHDTLKRLLKQTQDNRNSLEELKSRFESKIENVKALRDGASLSPLSIQQWCISNSFLQSFNASALVESRASTRLGENVQLLTYVSIFYLPIAFCVVCTCRMFSLILYTSKRLIRIYQASMGSPEHHWHRNSNSVYNYSRFGRLHHLSNRLQH